MQDDPIVREARARISELDRAILAAVNERLRVVQRLWEHKRDRGYDMDDPTREARMLHDLRSANEGPLSDDGVRSLLNAILDLTRREVSP
jgi:chorismate mutase